MNEAIKTEVYKGYTINIYHDDSSDNPIDWDPLGKYICFHQRYNLGHQHDYDSPDEVRTYAKRTGALLYPLYLYDHSGITISLSPYSCPWDSGQVGYVLVEKEDAVKEFGKKKLTDIVRKKVFKCIEGEVNTYDLYLMGEVYGYMIEDEAGSSIDSCWGYYGEVDSCIGEAQSHLDLMVKRKIENHCNKLKQWIRNKVDLIFRHPCEC